MTDRDGQIEITNLRQGEEQFVRALIDGLKGIDGVSGVALFIPRDEDERQALYITVPYSIGHSAITADPVVRAGAMGVVEKMRSLDGVFDFYYVTAIAGPLIKGHALIHRDFFVPLWQRSAE